MSGLVVFTCPNCGRRIEALGKAVVRCPCGRVMEKEEPIPKDKQDKVS